jgi:hypothetical protein
LIADVRGQMSEDRCQRTEGGGQMSEDRRRGTDVRGQKAEGFEFGLRPIGAEPTPRWEGGKTQTDVR